MKNLYAINDYNETSRTDSPAGLYATEELAIEQLRRWRKAIEAGKWDGTTFVKWHDSDDKEVTWMRIARFLEEHCYSVEPVIVNETEDDLID